MAATLDISLDVSERFDAVGEAGRETVERAIELTAAELWGSVADEAPVDHGRLAGSFLLEQMDSMSWRAYTLVEYAMAVQEGTEPHTIYPVNAKALYWPGAAHPVAKVEHPGTSPNPYATRAMKRAESRIDEFAERAVREAMERHNLG